MGSNSRGRSWGASCFIAAATSSVPLSALRSSKKSVCWTEAGREVGARGCREERTSAPESSCEDSCGPSTRSSCPRSDPGKLPITTAQVPYLAGVGGYKSTFGSSSAGSIPSHWGTQVGALFVLCFDVARRTWTVPGVSVVAMCLESAVMAMATSEE
eukprot:6180970-Pleurochrysis_carterae.AAC.5